MRRKVPKLQSVSQKLLRLYPMELTNEDMNFLFLSMRDLFEEIKDGKIQESLDSPKREFISYVHDLAMRLLDSESNIIELDICDLQIIKLLTEQYQELYNCYFSKREQMEYRKFYFDGIGLKEKAQSLHNNIHEDAFR